MSQIFKLSMDNFEWSELRLAIELKLYSFIEKLIQKDEKFFIYKINLIIFFLEF